MTVKRVQELVALFVERRESGDRTHMEAFAGEHPEYKEEHLAEDTYEYPVSFNGKMRFKVKMSLSLGQQELQKEIEALDLTLKWLDGKKPKKVIIVPGKIVNFVV